MAIATGYSALFYGGLDGYQDNRVQISLLDGNNIIAYIRFIVKGATAPQDFLLGANQIIVMHLPESMIDTIIDVLRNETPIGIVFANGLTRLSIGSGPTGEPIGENE